MKKLTMFLLLLLSLSVTGCIYGPDHGYGDHGWGGGDHRQNEQSHQDHDQH